MKKAALKQVKTLIWIKNSMKIYLNFKCESGAVVERYIDRDAKQTDCECGKVAKKTISMPRYLGNSTGKSPARH